MGVPSHAPATAHRSGAPHHGLAVLDGRRPDPPLVEPRAFHRRRVPGGLLRIVMAEGDSTRHTAVGRYLALEKPRALSFELAPLGPDGKPLLSAVHRVRLAPQPRGTTISLTIKLGDATPAAAPAIAGLRPGWKQLLDKLARELAGGRPPPAS